MAHPRSTPPLQRPPAPGKDEPWPARQQQAPFRERASGEGSQSAMERMRQVERRKATVLPTDERPVSG
ncbi:MULTISPECIES: hypothetical protein [Ramlibacter]|uniref:Uncharacterized protein n=1 Tax=Ramlibacter aquaticus TaxID=2780094 RepID=A0ABR9SFX2_9BURK|nr:MULTISPECIES: hypothetical protein [Ramlibacter]MBE7941243.1 hypothetical protein [Ramlibacter aquaticus]